LWLNFRLRKKKKFYIQNLLVLWICTKWPGLHRVSRWATSHSVCYLWFSFHISLLLSRVFSHLIRIRYLYLRPYITSIMLFDNAFLVVFLLDLNSFRMLWSTSFCWFCLALIIFFRFLPLLIQSALMEKAISGIRSCVLWYLMTLGQQWFMVCRVFLLLLSE
jgi:hypothetical protein